MMVLTTRDDAPLTLIDCKQLIPLNLNGLGLVAIANIPMENGNKSCSVGDIFAIQKVSGPDDELRLVGNTNHLAGVGHGLEQGTIVVEGDVGPGLGRAMRGGRIIVHGNAGDFVGTGMKGGTIHIRGSAGNSLGAAAPGQKWGVEGGTILVEGSAGDNIGTRMRRGLIAVAGNAGSGAGSNMVAGSVVLFGKAGSHVGVGMKRGTIVTIAENGPVIPASFRRECTYSPVFLELYLRHLHAMGFSAAHRTAGLVTRYRGDVLERGKGEILVMGRDDFSTPSKSSEPLR